MLGFARSLYVLIGSGALLMAIGGLMSEASISDPVFPAGLALGVVALAAAAWVIEPVRWRAVAVWLGVLGVLVGMGVMGVLVLTTTDLGTWPYFLVPAAVVLGATGIIGLSRVRAGALGAGAPLPG